MHQDDDLTQLGESNRASHSDSEPADEDDEDNDGAVPQGEGETEADFEGDSLQEAQNKIVTELTRLKDAE